MSLQVLINNYIQSPEDPMRNFELGNAYMQIGQTAAALSFFLRAAEFKEEGSLAYEALLKIGQCLASQNRRYHSEMGVLMHAINLCPERPEAYLLLSMLYERKKEWLESYLYASRAENLKGNAKATYTDVNFYSYAPTFQKAVAAFWIGKGQECAQLFYQLCREWGATMDERYKQAVLNNMKTLKLVQHPHQIVENTDRLVFKFPGHETIQRNYSQVLQDLFVLSMLNGKREGFFLEIGSADPYYGSNTVLLEKNFGWKGISIDFHSIKEFPEQRTSKMLVCNAKDVDYTSELSIMGLTPGSTVDYLQVDCEPAAVTYEVLTKIPFDKYRFAVITFEHDEYIAGPEFKEKSRELLRSHGYELAFDNVAPDNLCSFEDWWVDPKLVNPLALETLRTLSSKAKNPIDYLLLK